jgi:hypothetical protein
MRCADSRSEISYRELGDHQLQAVRTAVRGIVLATLAMSSGVAFAQVTLPPVVVTAPYPYGYGPDPSGGGGSGTSNPGCTADCNPGGDPPPPPPAIPPAQVPPMSKIICGAQTYGHYPKAYPTGFLNVFQFAKDLPDGSHLYTYSYTSNMPPSGFYPLDAVTVDPHPGTPWPSGQTTLYGSGVMPFNGSLTYIPPNSNQQVTQNRNYSAIENAVATAGHEFAHQHGVADESRAEGYGVAAADAYKNAHGAACP